MHPLQATLRRGITRPLDELRDELDLLWAPLTAAPPLHGWAAAGVRSRFPAVNVSENDEAIVIEAELPGLGPDEVDVSVHGDELVLRGNRSRGSAEASDDDAAASTAVWHRRERGTGSFERRLSLPVAIDADRVEAELFDGVLQVTCPKAAEAKSRKIAVKAS